MCSGIIKPTIRMYEPVIISVLGARKKPGKIEKISTFFSLFFQGCGKIGFFGKIELKRKLMKVTKK